MTKKLVPGMSQPGGPTIAKPAPSDQRSRLTPRMATDVPATVGSNQPDNRPIPPIDQQRVDFRHEEFVRIIQQHGQRVMWRKAMTCTCRKKETENARLTCPDCHGTGTRYVAPLQVKAVFQQHDQKTKIYEKFGTWLQHTSQVTIEAQYRLAFRDSLELLDAVGSYYELITKNDRTAYRQSLPIGRDVCRYRIKNMTHMIAQPPATLTSPRPALFEPELGVDYRISDGQIEWLPRGIRIPDGSVISVRYDYSPVYLVLHMIHATRNDPTGTLVPQVIMKAFPITGGVQLDFAFDATKDAEGYTIGDAPRVSATTGPICECAQ